MPVHYTSQSLTRPSNEATVSANASSSKCSEPRTLVIDSAPASLDPTPSSLKADARAKRASMRLNSGALQSFHASYPSSPLASPRSPSTQVQSRRQSSIAYFSPSQDVPRSPISSPSLSRSNSAKVRSLDGSSSTPRNVASKRASLGAAIRLEGVFGPTPQSPFTDEDRTPMTLVEKHADLLHSIAQKEAKCMDLRTQLLANEAELAQLKSKWERIAGRSLGHASGLGLAGPMPADNAIGTAAMLDGFKEGVQGAARLLVAGLADLSSTTSTMPEAATSRPVPKRRVDPGSRARHSVSSASSSPSPRFSTTSTSSLESLPQNFEATQSAASSEDTGKATVDHETGQSSARKAAPLRSRASVRRRRSGEAEAMDSAHDNNAGSSRLTPENSSPVSTAPADHKAVQQSKRISGLLENLTDQDPGSPVAPVSDWVKRKWAAADGTNQLRDVNRRASTLIADVGQRGQNWLSAFGGAPATSQPSAGKPRSKSPQPSAKSVSLLDDEDDDPWAASAGDILVPDTPVSPLPATAPLVPSDDFGDLIIASPSGGSRPQASPSKTDEFEDWNW